MSKAAAYVAKQEAGLNVSVIDVEDAGTPCRSCGSTGVVYTVHCWREENRPLVALCKPCAIERAEDAERVYVRSDRHGLREAWARGGRPLAKRRAGAI